MASTSPRGAAFYSTAGILLPCAATGSPSRGTRQQQARSGRTECQSGGNPQQGRFLRLVVPGAGRPREEHAKPSTIRVSVCKRHFAFQMRRTRPAGRLDRRYGCNPLHQPLDMGMKVRGLVAKAANLSQGLDDAGVVDGIAVKNIKKKRINLDLKN